MTKLCRICGKMATTYQDIFEIEGLVHKIETCLPVFVNPHSLLPNTICSECSLSINNFYQFIKQSLESIIILELQYNVKESCLESRRKQDKSCTASITAINQTTQTDNAQEATNGHDNLPSDHYDRKLVDYEILSDNSDDENVLTTTIKRESDTIINVPPKICKFDYSKRRKSRLPKKIIRFESDVTEYRESNFEENCVELAEQDETQSDLGITQSCLLCGAQFSEQLSLTMHIIETHNLNLGLSTLDGGGALEKKRKIPNLLKISDLMRITFDDTNNLDDNPIATFSELCCPICFCSAANKQELYSHCQTEHPASITLMCSICFRQSSTPLQLKNHVKVCSLGNPVTTRYFCSVCKYGDDSRRTMENHVLVHDFLLDVCREENKLFDPLHYVELNANGDFDPVSPSSRNLQCNICQESDFQSFEEFSLHRRKQHLKFHCDLCNKFYGSNSHLWKHVDRFHKNHPSITCQICFVTSSSKHHLNQHFAKMHLGKTNNNKKLKKNSIPTEFVKDEKKSSSSDFDDVSNNATSDQEEISDEVPKEVDASSDLYNKIITNYTPPPNAGEFKCTKCCKGFSKKILLKKHKKNCRPKMQKDLLTRCKSCARIFKDRQSLAKHLVNYHSEYTCEICLQKSQSKCEIVSHIRFTHPNCSLFCKLCGNVLRSIQSLSDHLKDHSNSYVCQFCGDSLSSKIKLKMHILSLHRKILSLSCGICLKLFENQHILKNHVQLVHKQDLIPFTSCTVCGKNYGSKWKTYDHLNKSHGRIFKVCKTCLEIFDNEDELNAHREENHRSNGKAPKIPVIGYPEYMDEWESDKEEPKPAIEDVKTPPPKPVKIKIEEHPQSSSKRTVYVNSDVPSLCEICLKTWPAKKHLWQHYIRCHKSAAATVCGICLKTNSDYRALQRHLMTNHPTLLHGQGFGSNFICRICGRYHNASSKLRIHMAIHENFDWSMLENNEAKPPDDYYESLIEQVECSSNDSEAKVEKSENSCSTDDDESESDSSETKNEKFKTEFQSDESSSNSCSSEENGNGNNSDSETQELDSAVRSISLGECTEEIKQELNIDYYDLSMGVSALNEREIESAVGSIL